MVDDLSVFTLIGEKQAKIGFKFLFTQAASECNNCNLKPVCIDNLNPRTIYEIIEVRDVIHECPIHGRVSVVRVRPAEIEVVIPSRNVFVNAIISYEPIVCENYACPYHDLCEPIGLEKGDKVKIIKIMDNKFKEKCKEKHSLSLVLLRKVS